ncbi:MAG: DoxX family protein [Arenicellales bacterium]|nr:DoxX family protein [Arenicellales bacterium]
MKWLDNYKDHTYALLRIVSGFLFIWHGTQKFFNFPVEYPFGSLNPIAGAAGAIELVGGTLIMIGLFTRSAAFICSGTMAVAYWMAHGTKSFFPIANGGEIAALYCFIFLFIAARGAGLWSVGK